MRPRTLTPARRGSAPTPRTAPHRRRRHAHLHHERQGRRPGHALRRDRAPNTPARLTGADPASSRSTRAPSTWPNQDSDGTITAVAPNRPTDHSGPAANLAPRNRNGAYTLTAAETPAPSPSPPRAAFPNGLRSPPHADRDAGAGTAAPTRSTSPPPTASSPTRPRRSQRAQHGRPSVRSPPPAARPAPRPSSSRPPAAPRAHESPAPPGSRRASVSRFASNRTPTLARTHPTAPTGPRPTFITLTATTHAGPAGQTLRFRLTWSHQRHQRIRLARH